MPALDIPPLCELAGAIRELPAVVHHFHLSTHDVAGTGTFFVEQARSRAGRLVARALRLPRAVGDTPVTLSITRRVQADRRSIVEHWRRTFNNEVMASTQRTDGHHLLERIGRIELRFAVEVERRRLCFRQVGTRLRIGPVDLPIPRAISPAIAASVGAVGDRLDVSVLISAPVFGTLFHYAGQLTPREDT
jgi:hypothetical protein